MATIKPMRLLLQALNYALFMLLVWYFSIYPPYRQLEDDQAIITLAFGHTAKRIGECTRLSAAEQAKLAPNMRQAVDCPRERSSVTIELHLDGELAAKVTVESPGLYNDQGVDIYEDIKASTGPHLLSVWMNDDANVDGPTYQYEDQIELHSAQRLVVAFDSKKDGFSVD